MHLFSRVFHSELLSGEVSQWFDECGGGDSFVIEKTPGCLSDGEGIFDAGGHGDTGDTGDTGGGSGGLLHMLADEVQ